MYKVLIVDDEIFVRKGLTNLMNWSSLQYEICGEAENGQQAIELIEQLKPDLVIADIRMPMMDGLDLIKYVKEKGNHQPLFIIISGYHDFSYAQQALRYNVSDYILKPVDEKELTSTLKKVTSTLNQMKLMSFTGEKPLVETVIETLLQTEPSDQVIQQISQVLKLPVSSPYTYVIIEIQDLLPPGTVDYLPALHEVLQRYFQSGDAISLIHVRENNQYGLILPHLWLAQSSENEYMSYTWLLEILKKEIKETIVLFIGSREHYLKNIVHSCSSANECLNYRFASGSRGIIMASDTLSLSLYYFDVEEELHSKLIDEIEDDYREGYEAVIHTMFEQFQERRYAPVAVNNTIRRSIIAVINIIRKLEGDEKDLLLLNELLDWPNKHRNLDQLRLIFFSYAEEAATYIAEKRSERGKGNIGKIKRYIDAHFTENMNLKGIATKFYMNPVYLGQLFRKSYGVYFNEYLLTLRIEEAKRLLRQTNKRMYEIAEMVGFQNSDYFATQFEKMEKMTPTDYRNMINDKK